MANPEFWKFIEAAPVSVQIFFSVAMAAVLGLIGAKAYLKTLNAPEPPTDPRNLLLAAGTIADMKPVHEVAKHTKEAAEILSRIEKRMHAEFEKQEAREERERQEHIDRLERENAELRRQRYTPS